MRAFSKMNLQSCCCGLRTLRILSLIQLLFSTQIHGAQENDELTAKTSKELDENVFYQDNAVRNRRNLWIDKIIPYELDFSRITVTMNKSIHEAIAEYHAKTCIRFVKHTTERNWIKFTTSSYCSTRIGRQFRAGYQNIYLSHICDDKRAVLHELMHTLGFYHEMSRPDRDLYVEILWENISKGYYRSFRKVSDKYVDKLGIMYDYDSLVHYNNWAFSKNGKVTVRSRKDPKRDVGHAKTFSKLDLIKINALYDCTGKLGGWSSWSGFSQCDTKCKKYRQRFCYSKNRRKDCPLADQHGIETEVAKCSRKECYAPVDGQWSKWSEWSVCSTSCGYGNKTRKRQCDDPVPKHGGKKCVGESLQSTSCLMESRGPVYYRFMVYSIKHKKCLSHWGNRITLETCNKNVTRQKWAWSAYDQLVSISTGLCLDLSKGAKEDSLVLLSRCCKEKPSQQWSCDRTMIKPNNTDVYISYKKKQKLVQLRSNQGQSSQWKVFGTNATNLCSQKPDCTTKTERKGCCEFPFTYRGVVYKSCAISITSGRKWCATSRNYPHDRKWGYCPIQKTKACQVKTTKGECCVFPFKYQNKLYHSCTTVNFRNRRWCATTSDFDKDKKWGRC